MGSGREEKRKGEVREGWRMGGKKKEGVGKCKGGRSRSFEERVKRLCRCIDTVKNLGNDEAWWAVIPTE